MEPRTIYYNRFAEKSLTAKKIARIRPLIREILKGGNNATVGKINMKTNKYPFHEMLNYVSDLLQLQENSHTTRKYYIVKQQRNSVVEHKIYLKLITLFIILLIHTVEQFKKHLVIFIIFKYINLFSIFHIYFDMYIHILLKIYFTMLFAL